MDLRQAQAEILSVLEVAPIVNSDVKKDVTELVQVGEVGLAFDTLCSWLYEDALPISIELYRRLRVLAEGLELQKSIEKLDELVVE